MNTILHDTREPMSTSDPEPEPRNAPKHRLQRCPYRQDLKHLFCGETGCDLTDCPIWMKESGRLADAKHPY